MWRDSLFDGVAWWRLQELEIQEENNEVIKEPMNSSLRSVSTSTNKSSSSVQIVSTGEGRQDGIQGMPARAMPVLKSSAPIKEWFCEYPNCGRSFTHRYRLKYYSP
jgi:hypothetical protein